MERVLTSLSAEEIEELMEGMDIRPADPCLEYAVVLFNNQERAVKVFCSLLLNHAGLHRGVNEEQFVAAGWPWAHK